MSKIDSDFAEKRYVIVSPGRYSGTVCFGDFAVLVDSADPEADSVLTSGLGIAAKTSLTDSDCIGLSANLENPAVGTETADLGRCRAVYPQSPVVPAAFPS